MSDRRDADEALLRSAGRRAEALELTQVRRVGGADPLQQFLGPPAPVWLNTETSKAPDGLCVVYAGTRRCQATARMRVWIGCEVGEHLDKSEVCTPHAQDIARRGDTYTCQRCWDVLGSVSRARVIKIEAIDDDDTEPALARSADLLS